MKYEVKIKRKMNLHLTLGSSEVIMLNQGGRHSLNIPQSIFEEDFDDIEISVQLERSEQQRHTHVVTSAVKHIEQEHRKLMEQNEN